MSNLANGLLLDTHALIWMVEGTLGQAAQEVLVAAGTAHGLYVSPVSAWEVGLLCRSKPGRPGLDFAPDPHAWFSSLINRQTILDAAFTPAIALGACFLPGAFHNDPADRFLVATARAMNIPLMTRDKQIHDYAAQGHVQAVLC